MRELLVATSNHGKLLEIMGFIGDMPFELMTLDGMNLGSVSEPGKTFEGNAIIKAMTYGKRSGKLTLAEDTGLEVDAFDGRPGVLTARYAEGDKARNQKLLEELADIPDEQRTARFRTVAALFDPVSDEIWLAEGECHGRILREYRGDKSFGFGPLFFVDELQHTLSEVELDVRNTVSHRGRALQGIRTILSTLHA